ncbi:MAG: FAD-dependent oxidoreductase [Acidimicrobiales bacterium]|nr:FAD-dependent oxidoreductase [Acidimicrobiales bacterium]
MHPSLAETKQAVFWVDQLDTRTKEPVSLIGSGEADLVIIGGGFTGLWTALLASEANPGRKIFILESETVGYGASSRNGGFCDASITHGIENGMSHWPEEMPTLLRLGRENLNGIAETIRRHNIGCDVEATGEMAVAVEQWQVDQLLESANLARSLGESVEFLDSHAVKEQVHSPTYLAGLWNRDSTLMLDPGKLVKGLQDAVTSLGVTIFENSPVADLEKSGNKILVSTKSGKVSADRVVVATNAFNPVLRKMRRYVIPVYDHVLVSEPLSGSQLESLNWLNRQGVGDSGNQFHYYRLTKENRILWGGYDAHYHFGSRMGPEVESNDQTCGMLAEHFFETFPQLEGLSFTHKWSGPIGTTTRFSCSWGSSHNGQVSWAVGYTGLGVGASRFGAQVALDLVDGIDTERTELEMVRKTPFPFPPEPFRWLGVQITSSMMKRSDRNEGRRGLWLKLLDRFGIGFDS